jgi:HPt (histidine-containing phosphotransfer) domain-containing protein
VLGEWFANDAAAVDELLAVFRDSALTEHARMAEALAQGDLTALAQAAHRLRGVALSMGAQKLAEAAAVLDTAAKAGDSAACLPAMVQVEAAMSRMVAEVPAGQTPRPRSS